MGPESHRSTNRDLPDGATPAGPCSERAAYSPNPGTLDRALSLVRFLRAHCDWDARQTPASLIKHLLEEAGEVADAVRAGQVADLRDELGDLLLNLAFQIVIAEERDQFDADAVASTLEEKMVRRHPHLFHGGELASWDELKEQEEGGESLLDALQEGGSSPLAEARLIQERVSSVGFDWERPEPAIEKVREESLELENALAAEGSASVKSEVGDLLFAAVNVARLCGVDAGQALAATNQRFSRRFQDMEGTARDRGLRLADLDLATMDELWEEAKDREA